MLTKDKGVNSTNPRPTVDRPVHSDIDDAMPMSEPTLVDAVQQAADVIAAPPLLPTVDERGEDHSSDEELPDGRYVVREVLGARGERGKNRVYRVAWKGYGADHNSDVVESDIDPDGPMADMLAEWNAVLPRDKWNYRPDAVLVPEEVYQIYGVVNDSSHRGRKKARPAPAWVRLTMRWAMPADQVTLIPINRLTERIFDANHLSQFASKEVRKLVKAAYYADRK